MNLSLVAILQFIPQSGAKIAIYMYENITSCPLQDMLDQWSMSINARLNLWYWHQCRSINIKFWINNRILIWHWLVLIGIDLWSSMSCHCIVTWVTWWVIGNCASVQVFNCTWWSYWSTRVTCFPILEACTVGYLNLHRKKIWFTLDRQLFLLTSRESIFLYRFLNWNCGCSDFRKKGMCGELSLSTICGLLSAVSCICHSYSDMVTVCM